MSISLYVINIKRVQFPLNPVDSLYWVGGAPDGPGLYSPASFFFSSSDGARLVPAMGDEARFLTALPISSRAVPRHRARPDCKQSSIRSRQTIHRPHLDTRKLGIPTSKAALCGFSMLPFSLPCALHIRPNGLPPIGRAWWLQTLATVTRTQHRPLGSLKPGRKISGNFAFKSQTPHQLRSVLADSTLLGIRKPATRWRATW
jgi:hypothetical protein